MSIAGISNSINVAPSTAISATQNSQINSAADPDGDGDGGVRKSRGHGHGQMQAVLMQALQSLGLSPTSATGAANSTTGSNSTSKGGASADSDGDADGSTPATGSVKSDMRNLMHALFQAVKSENSSTSTAATGSTDPKANFAAGLSALITQVSNGNAPADLQDAFSQVAKDLQANSSTLDSTTSSSSGSTPQATLQALLTQLQQNLGYGASSSTAGIGNLLSAQA